MIGATAGTLICVVVFRGRGCEWLPENRVLQAIGTSRLSQSEYTKCLQRCYHVSDSDIFNVFSEGNVDFSKSQTKEIPKRYVVSSKTKKGTDFQADFIILTDTTVLLDKITIDNEGNCECDDSKHTIKTPFYLPKSLLVDVIRDRPLKFIGNTKCQLICIGETPDSLKSELENWKVNYELSRPYKPLNPTYTFQKAGKEINVELGQKSSRVFQVLTNEQEIECSCPN